MAKRTAFDYISGTVCPIFLSFLRVHTFQDASNSSNLNRWFEQSYWAIHEMRNNYLGQNANRFVTYKGRTNKASYGLRWINTVVLI